MSFGLPMCILVALTFCFLETSKNCVEAAYIQRNKDCHCGLRKKKDGPSARIVNGDDADPHEFPWMVGLATKRGNTPVCGGTLISDFHVITAAHCTVVQLKYAYLGDHKTNDPTDGGKTYPILKVINHPKYEIPEKGIPNYDIAVIVLKYRVLFSLFDYIRPLCLGNFCDFKEEGEALIAGWGKVKTNGEKSKKLLYAKVDLITNEKCGDVYSNATGKIEDVHMCAGGKGFDTCQGDSGGPIFAKRPYAEMRNVTLGVQYELIGITSFGLKCGGIGIPGGYARFFSWNLVVWLFDTMRSHDVTHVKVCDGLLGKLDFSCVD